MGPNGLFYLMKTEREEVAGPRLHWARPWCEKSSVQEGKAVLQ